MSERTESTTPPHPKLTAALVKAQAMMEAAKKESTNDAFARGGKGGKYSDLASVGAAIKEPFAQVGLGWRHKTKSDTTAAYVKCVIFHESGEEMEDEDWLRIALAKTTAHEIGSAITYGRRFTLQAAVGIVSDDDDGNAASGKSKPPEASAYRAPTYPHLPDASQELAREVRPEPKQSPSIRVRAKRVWEKQREAGASAEQFRTWATGVLGMDVPSADWKENDVAQLEAALEEALGHEPGAEG